MTRTIIIIGLVLLSISLALGQQQQEVVIIGTMHTVPGIVSQAYKPMLKKAINYQPQDIYVERQPAWDTVSVKNYFPKFFAKADSLSKAMAFDKVAIDKLLAKTTATLTKEEASQLKLYYYSKFDFANMEFYRRVARYGVDGYDKPSRNENGDLTYPLAIAMGIKHIKSMDNQTYSSEYFKSWKGCDAEGKKDGELKYLKKALNTLKWREYTGLANLMNLGAINNFPKNVKLMHKLNSMEYRETNTKVCDEANYYWDYRNDQMVKNTAIQVLESGNLRSVVIVGAGHVYGMIEAFKRDYPQIKVIRYNDMMDNTGKVDPRDNISETVLIGHR